MVAVDPAQQLARIFAIQIAEDVGQERLSGIQTGGNAQAIFQSAARIKCPATNGIAAIRQWITRDDSGWTAAIAVAQRYFPLPHDKPVVCSNSKALRLFFDDCAITRDRDRHPGITARNDILRRKTTAFIDRHRLAGDANHVGRAGAPGDGGHQPRQFDCPPGSFIQLTKAGPGRRAAINPALTQRMIDNRQFMRAGFIKFAIRTIDTVDEVERSRASQWHCPFGKAIGIDRSRGNRRCVWRLPRFEDADFAPRDKARIVVERKEFSFLSGNDSPFRRHQPGAEHGRDDHGICAELDGKFILNRCSNRGG